MNRFLILFLIVPCLAFSSLHKFYVSVTQVDHVPDKKAVQIITRIFIDDFETLIRERYDKTVTLVEANESEKIEGYMQHYLKDKFMVKINGKAVRVNFIGKEYDRDVVKCYLEIENVDHINSMEISNKVLFDLFPDQQNIIKTKINTKHKSFILEASDDKALLKFN